MKVLLVHITDIHTKKNSEIEKYIDSLVKIIKNKAVLSSKIYLIFTGDIAFSGSSEEYGKFARFLRTLRKSLEFFTKEKPIREVFIPGNHDCNFEKDNDLRKSIISRIDYDILGDDNSIAESCLIVQEDFWVFYSEWNELPKNKLYYVIEDQIENQKIFFHCFNTAWLSSRREKVGQVFLPTKKFKSDKFKGFNIALYHHPLNWFNPNTNDNNKQEFEKYSESLAVLHLLGHEHEESSRNTSNLQNRKNTNHLSGKVFNENKEFEKNISGFQIIQLDLDGNSGELFTYVWKDSLYIEDTAEVILNFQEQEAEQFLLKEDFKATLNELNIPLIQENKKKIYLNDVFVWPDLDNKYDREDYLESYTNSLKAVENNDHLIIDGESQIGKSSLLKMSFQHLYSLGKFPIILRGRDIKESTGDSEFKKAFKSTYKYVSLKEQYSQYDQLPNSKRVLLIEDFHESSLSFEAIKKVLSFFTMRFGKVIVVADATDKVWANLQIEFEGFKTYSLKGLGYKKRNELIEKYHSLNNDTQPGESILKVIQQSFNNVQSILGDKLMPPYPVYILSILQALQYTPIQGNEASYAFCYQTLIHYALLNAGVKPENIDTHMNFLAELAFHFIEEDQDEISQTLFTKFYTNYSEKYICPSIDSLIETLKKSRILHFDSEQVKFGYNYILYFLAARKISGIIHLDQGKQIVKSLFEKYHKNKYANILVFITHHTQDISFIEDTLLQTMLVLEDKVPVTIEKNDIFNTKISSLVEGLKQEIIDIHKNPKEERIRQLEEKDKVENGVNKKGLDEEIEEAFLPFYKSFRSVEIIGQIVKTRKGSLDKPSLTELVKESYVTGFRTISYLVELLEKERDELILIIQENDSDKISDLVTRINELIQYLIFKFSFSILRRITHSVGHKDLKIIYSEVANLLNTPVAKLTTFYINSYYNKISESELKAYKKDFAKNLVAMKYLRRIVIEYVYNNELKQSTKQSFAAILGLNVAPLNKINQSKN